MTIDKFYDAFLIISECFNMYKIYAYNYNNCITLLSKLKNEKFGF